MIRTCEIGEATARDTTRSRAVLFHETLDLGWVGPRADRAAELADNVARVHSQQLIGHAVAVAAPHEPTNVR